METAPSGSNGGEAAQRTAQGADGTDRTDTGVLTLSRLATVYYDRARNFPDEEAANIITLATYLDDQAALMRRDGYDATRRRFDAYSPQEHPKAGVIRTLFGWWAHDPSAIRTTCVREPHAYAASSRTEIAMAPRKKAAGTTRGRKPAKTTKAKAGKRKTTAKRGPGRPKKA